jgi:hypothetical protein
MPSNVRNKYTNTEIAKSKVKSVANAAGRRVNSAREQARLTLNSAGAAVERAKRAADQGYGAKIRYKVESAKDDVVWAYNKARGAYEEGVRRFDKAKRKAAKTYNDARKEVGRRLNQNSITKGTAKGSGGMPSNVRNKYTNTEIAKSKVKSVGRRAGQLYDEAGRRINAAKDAAVNTYNDVRREAGRRLNNAAYQLNPNANDVTRGRSAAGMPSNVRSKYTNTENLKRGAKGALNAAGKRVNAAKDAAVDTFNDVRREAGRRLNNAKYYANPNANKTTRGLNAAGMPSDVRSRHTNAENLKRGAKSAVDKAGKKINEVAGAPGRAIEDAKNKISKRVNDALTAAGQTAAKAMIAEVKKEINSGTPTNEIKGYSTARKILKDIGLSPEQIAKELGIGYANSAQNAKRTTAVTKQQEKAFYDDIRDGMARTGQTGMQLLKENGLDVLLEEFGGFDPSKMTPAQKKRIRDALKRMG